MTASAKARFNEPFAERITCTTAGRTAQLVLADRTSTTTARFTDWSAPVTIAAPPADQVGPLSLN